MKAVITALIISLGLVSATAYAKGHDASPNRNIELRNIKLVTQLYKNVYEKKDFDNLDKFVSNDVQFYKDFSSPLNYDALKQHLITQGEACININMLPFDSVVASGNKVVTYYTRKCTDQSNRVEQRRVMAITQIDHNKVSKIWVVSHEADQPA